MQYVKVIFAVNLYFGRHIWKISLCVDFKNGVFAILTLWMDACVTHRSDTERKYHQSLAHSLSSPTFGRADNGCTYPDWHKCRYTLQPHLSAARRDRMSQSPGHTPTAVHKSSVTTSNFGESCEIAPRSCALVAGLP